MWNAQTKLVPITIGATGTVSKSLIHYLGNIPGKYEIKELQKNSHTGHLTHTVLESADVEVQNVCHWICLYVWHKL